MQKDCNNQIKVICKTNIGHGSEFCVVVIDSETQDHQCGLTDSRGVVAFDVDCNKTYIVRAYPCGCFQPRCQTRWVTIDVCRKTLNFCFFEPQFSKPLGKLTITLCDKYYPEYKLEQGEYQLWRTF